MERTDKGGREFADLSTLEAEISSAEQAIGDFRGQYDAIMENFAESKSAYDAAGKLISDLTEMYTDGMVGAAKNGVDGYTNWINSRNAHKPVEDANIELAKKAYEAFNKGQDAHSPSKKFGEAAKYSVDGYVQGIAGNKNRALSTMGAFISEILSKFSGISERFSVKGKEIVSGIWSGIKEKWGGFIRDWAGKKDSIVSTFSNMKNTMADIGRGIVNGLIEGISSVWDMLVRWAGSIRDLFNIRPSVSAAGVSMVGGVSPRVASYSQLMPHIPETPIPALATGAVIPPNREFLAVLGDQKSGTNIEAPEGLIRKIVREETRDELMRVQNQMGGSPSGGHVIHNVVQINRRTLVDEIVKVITLRQTVTGRNPFELA